MDSIPPVPFSHRQAEDSTSGSTEADTVDEVLSIVVELCEIPKMAKACASYERFRAILIGKLAAARNQRSSLGVALSVRLGEQLFASSQQPGQFSGSEELVSLLVDIIAKDANTISADAINAAGRLLNSLACCAKIV